MTLRVEPGDLAEPALVALLQGHVDQLRAITPRGSAHALDLEALRAPGLSLWVARDDAGLGEVVGCAALKRLTPTHAELKSMRTDPDHTGRGVGATLLDRLLAHARCDDVLRVSLETGAGRFFAPAHRLYLRHGFLDCGPFADYRPDPHSRFMTREL